jgi:hypothetical protein
MSCRGRVRRGSKDAHISGIIVGISPEWTAKMFHVKHLRVPFAGKCLAIRLMLTLRPKIPRIPLAEQNYPRREPSWIWSLWEMILKYGTYYQELQEMLQKLEQFCEPRQPPLSSSPNALDMGLPAFAALMGDRTAEFTPLTELISDHLKIMETQATELELERTLDRLIHVREYVKSLGSAVNLYGDHRLPHEIRVLREALYDDLRKRSIWFPSTEKMKFVETFGTRMNFAVIHRNMPDAHYELIKAENCYCTDNDPACVYHALNAAEYALRAIATRFRVPPKQRDSWGTMMASLRTKSRRLTEKKAHETAKRNSRLLFRTPRSVCFLQRALAKKSRAHATEVHRRGGT